MLDEEKENCMMSMKTLENDMKLKLQGSDQREVLLKKKVSLLELKLNKFESQTKEAEREVTRLENKISQQENSLS